MGDDTIFLAEIASLASLGKREKLKSAIKRALANRVNLIKVEETILQVYLFAGFPAMIEGFSVLREIAGDGKFVSEKYDIEKFLERGMSTCRKVYGEIFDKLIENMNSLHPDITTWMLVEGYGKVLSRVGLSLKERELVNVAILTSLGWERQLYAHIKGAINVGASREEIASVIRGISKFCGKRKVERAVKIVNSI